MAFEIDGKEMDPIFVCCWSVHL